jgi:EmrB/QacA subfamily drug resistance transporter
MKMSIKNAPSKGLLPSIALSLMTVISAVSALNIALPDVAKNTGATQTQLTWIVDAYTVVFAGLLLLSGAVADKYGRKTLLQAGLLIYLGANIFGTLAGPEMSPETLIAIRIITGVGASMIMPSTLSVITTSFEKEERAKAVGVWVAVAGGGAVVGLFGTAVLMIWFDWTSFFWLNMFLAAVGFLGVSVNVRNSKSQDQHPLDIFGGLLSIGGVSGLVFGIIEGPERGWDDIVTINALAIGSALLVAFVLWELKSKHPLLDPRFFKIRAFSAGSISITVQFLVQFGFIFVGMQYLQFVGGFEPWQAALHLIPLPFVMLPGTRIVGHLSKRHPQRLLGSIGMTAFAIAMFMFSTLGATFNLWLFEGALVLMATGIAFAATPATTAITSSLPEAKQGVASAVNDVAREFGSAIGIATLGAALTSAYKSNMITYADSVTFPPQIPADKVDEFSNFISDSPAVMSIDINDLPSALQPAKPFLETIWNALQNAATSAFSLGSGDALRLAGLIALGGAIFIAVVAPKKSSEAI